jgi:hypothetical protein
LFGLYPLSDILNYNNIKLKKIGKVYSLQYTEILKVFFTPHHELYVSRLKMAVFWVVAPCSLAIALMMEAARTSETLVNFYQTTRCYNPEDSNLHTHRRENLKSYLVSRLLH